MNFVFLGAKEVPGRTLGLVLKYWWKEILSGFYPMQCFHGKTNTL